MPADGRVHNKAEPGTQPNVIGAKRGGWRTIGNGARRGSGLMKSVGCCAIGGGPGTGVPAQGRQYNNQHNMRGSGRDSGTA